MTKATMLDTIATKGKVTPADAERVLAVYRAERIVSYGSHDGYQIQHGAFFDHDVIQRALALA